MPRRALGEPGVLEELARAAGLRAAAGALVDVPYRAPGHRDTWSADLLSAGNTPPGRRALRLRRGARRV